jgi:hypothetical protein
LLITNGRAIARVCLRSWARAGYKQTTIAVNETGHASATPRAN